MGTFNATQLAAFRRKVDGEPAVDIQVAPNRKGVYVYKYHRSYMSLVRFH